MTSEETYLLDTQVALWLLLGDKQLNEVDFRKRFAADRSIFIFHQLSTWEIQIKYSLGKLKLPAKPGSFLLRAVNAAGLVYEPLDDEGIFFLDRLPQIHRDPFDRLLISHAMVKGWTIISADNTFEQYPVKLELL